MGIIGQSCDCFAVYHQRHPKTAKAVACLAYPCQLKNWLSLNERGRLIQKADLAAGNKSLQIWLIALPMSAATQEVAGPFEQQLRSVVR